jgi:hypothetical protein
MGEISCIKCNDTQCTEELPPAFNILGKEMDISIGLFRWIGYVCAMHSKQNWYHLYYYCQAKSFGEGKMI